MLTNVLALHIIMANFNSICQCHDRERTDYFFFARIIKFPINFNMTIIKNGKMAPILVSLVDKIAWCIVFVNVFAKPDPMKFKKKKIKIKITILMRLILA